MTILFAFVLFFVCFPPCGRRTIFLKIHSKYRRHCKNRRPCQVKRLLSGSIRSFPIQTVLQISRPATCRVATKSMERAVDQIRDGTRAAYRLARTLSQTFEELRPPIECADRDRLRLRVRQVDKRAKFYCELWWTFVASFGSRTVFSGIIGQVFVSKLPSLPVAIEFNSLLNLLLVEILCNEIPRILPLTIRPFSQCFNGTPNISCFYSNKSQTGTRFVIVKQYHSACLPHRDLPAFLKKPHQTRENRPHHVVTAGRDHCRYLLLAVGLPFSANFLSLSMSSRSRRVPACRPIPQLWTIIPWFILCRWKKWTKPGRGPTPSPSLWMTEAKRWRP